MAMLSNVLLVIDLQEGVCNGVEPAHKIEQLVQRVNARIESYVIKGKKIIYIQHCDDELMKGEPEWEILHNIKLVEESDRIDKTHANSFL